MKKKTIQDFLPKVISRKQYFKTVQKLTDLQISIMKLEYAVGPDVLNDLSKGIKDIVGCFGGEEGIGFYSTGTLNYIMQNRK